ncbi:MAG: hypothetical protein HY822_10925 [Acidobacteria bacterium]|nr:hypothetical protein [Acidobacteriota bacterium]
MFTIRAVLLVLLAAAGCSRPPQTATAPRAAWLQNEPLVIVGNWDSMPIFQRRRGGQPADHDESYRKEHTEEAVLKLKDLGVTMAVLHFYKGFGLAAEKEHMEDARKLAALCKKHGLRVGVYVGSTIAYETFLAEKPEAQEWFVTRYLGRPVTYGDQVFRKRVYFMHPGYREYMKRVLRIAVQDLKADLIHFDNTSLQARPEIFLHPQAVTDFRAFLKHKYPPETLNQRLGFSDVRFVEPPEFDRPMVTITDPIFQEWADFRCHQLAAYYEEMGAYIRGLNPEVAVENNPHSGISGRNTVWQEGVDYPRLLRPLDVVWTEEGNPAGIDSNGILVSKIRTYKMGALLKNRIFTYTGGARNGKLAMAEAMAYNRMTLGMVGGMLAGEQLAPDQRNYVRFYRNNFEYYRDVESRAEVAVLHSFASMAYSNDQPWLSSMLFEQALIQNRIPFDIVFDENLKDLSRYRVLVLAGQECLSDEQLGLIRGFAGRGGGVVVAGDSALYDQWRRCRRESGLKDLKAVTVPSVEPAVEKPPAAAATSQYWKLPLNWQALIAAVRQAAGGRLSAEVTAPPAVTAEVLEQKQKRRLLVHLVNYHAPPVRDIGVSLSLPAGSAAGKVALLSPDHETSSADGTWKNDRFEFTVPALKTYSLAVVQLK